jgi:hypothetical protein
MAQDIRSVSQLLTDIASLPTDQEMIAALRRTPRFIHALLQFAFGDHEIALPVTSPLNPDTITPRALVQDPRYGREGRMNYVSSFTSCGDMLAIESAKLRRLFVRGITPPSRTVDLEGHHRPIDAAIASGGVGRRWGEADSLSATYLIRANPLLTDAQKPRTETEEKACSSERAKEAVRQVQHYAARAPGIDAATPRAAVGNGATPGSTHTKNKTDREAYNGCCPCGHRDSPVCLCVYIDETMRGDSVVTVKRHNSRSGITSDGRGPRCGLWGTSISCLHDQVLAKSMTAMPPDGPASPRKLRQNR